MSQIEKVKGPEAKGKVLLVAANPGVSEQTGWPVGVWASELTHPYYEFTSNGYEVVIASPNGGKIEFDMYSDPRHESGYSADDWLSRGFIESDNTRALIENTEPIGRIDVSDFDAIMLLGGQSPMFNFRGNSELIRLFTAFYESGKPTSAICHGTCILLEATLSNGELLVEGKSWTGFANDEERIADEAVGRRIQPFWIETEARKLEGTDFLVEVPFTPFAVRDGNLITGQQQNSGKLASALVMNLIAEHKKSIV